MTSSTAVNGGASCTAGTRRTGEVSGRDSPDLGRQGPCLGQECPAVLSRALPSSDVSLPSGFSGRLSLRASTGGEPVKEVPYRPIQSQTVPLPTTVERTIKPTRVTPAVNCGILSLFKDSSRRQGVGALIDFTDSCQEQGVWQQKTLICLW